MSLVTSRHLALIGKVINWANEYRFARLFLLLLLFFAFESVCQGQPQTFSTPGTSTFTIPAGVTSITVQAWGGGGAGGQANSSSHGKGGGGGGAYASSVLTVNPGDSYTVTVGAGGTAPNATTASTSGGASSFGTLVIALGGTNGDNTTASGAGGAGGLASGSTGTVKYNGGNGGAGNTSNNGGGGGGGSSATATGVGVVGGNASGNTGGIGGNGANGDGGAGGNNGVSGVSGTTPGGGGGGRGDGGTASGNGANGQVIVSWTCPANAGTLSGTSNICISGGTTTFTSTVPGGTWSSSNPSVATIIPASGVITAQASGGGGTVTMTYTIPASGSCSAVTATKSLTVDNLPTVGIISGTATQCPALTGQVYSITPVSGVTSYTWTVPAGWTITSGDGTTSITVTTGSAGQNGNISVTSTNSCGNSPASTKAVTVSPGTPATPGAITGSATQCPALTGQVYSIAAVTNATTYTWSVPPGWTITNGQGTTSITVTTGSSGQNGNISVTAGNSCGTSAASSLAVTVSPGTPLAPAANAGSAASCSQVTANWTASTNATSYRLDVSTLNSFASFVPGYQDLNVGNVTIYNVTGLTSGTTYYYRIRAVNSCGTSTNSGTITYSTLPATPAVPGAITGTTAQCPALTVQVYSISAVPNATTYTWSVPTGWTITNGQGTTSISVTTGSAGQNGNISVTAGNSCGTSAASSLAVTVSPGTPSAPAANAGSAAGCSQVTANWTASANATSYRLDVSTLNSFASFISGFQDLNVGNVTTYNVTGLTSGTTYYYRIRAVNSCGTSTSSGTITYSTLPATPATPGAITGTTAQCPALTGQVYSIAAVSNATTYTWTVPTGWTITNGQGTTSITVTTGSTGQNGNISVTAGNSCGTSAARNLAVTVDPGTPATPGAITGTTAQCPALTGQTYSIAAVTNATTYTWTVPTGWTITNGQGTTSITVTTGVAGQNGNVSVTAGNSCGTSAANSLAVTVNPGTPAIPGAITGTAAQCPALTGQVYSIAAVTNATAYTWTVPTGWTITSGAGTTSITVTTGSAGQNGNVSVTAGNSCGNSASNTKAVTVNPGTPATPGAITGTTAQCPALTGQVYSIAAVPNATTYTWTVSTGWTITSGAGTNSITLTTGATGQNGNISVTAGNSCGTSAANSLAVTVDPGTPATPGAITGTTAQCPALTGQVYSIAAVPNATTYSWTVPAGWTITSGAGTTSITVTTGSSGQNGNISVTAGNSCGNSASSNLAVTVNPGTPSKPGAITGTTAQCPALTGQAYSIAAVPDATTYSWTVPTGWTITSGAGTTSITVTTGSAGENGNISITAGNSCGTSAANSLAVSVDPGTPATPGAITGTMTQCPGLTGQVYSITPVSNATIYTWIVPTGWTITSGAGTTSITVTTGAAGQNGNISVTAGNSCGTSAANSLAVTVDPGTPATPGAITGTATQCPALTGEVYSIAAVPNATSYTWTIPTGWAITSGDGTTSITVTTGTAGQNGSITVYADNSCGNSAGSSMAVTVNPGTPAAPGAIAGSIFTTPATSGLVYSIAAVPNATTYNWTVPVGWTITSGAGSNSITVKSGTASQDGNITVTAANSCGTSASSSLYVNIDPALSVTADPLSQTDCEGNDVVFSVGISGGSGIISYSWERKRPTDGSFSAIVGDTDISYPSAGSMKVANTGSTSNPNQTQYRVIITDSGTGNVTSGIATLTVNRVSAITPSNQTICDGENSSFTVSTEGSLPVSYQWIKQQSPGVWMDVANGGSISGATTSTITFTGVTPSDAGDYKVKVEFPITQPNNNGGNPATCIYTSTVSGNLTINPLPVLTAVPTVCVGKTINILPSSGGTWTSSDPTKATVTNAGLVTGISIGTVTFTYTETATGCHATTPGVEITPIPTATAPLAKTYCQGDVTTPIVLTGTPSGVVFDISGGAAIGLTDQTGVTSIPAFTALAGVATITITPRANGCSGTSASFSITVNTTPTLSGVSQSAAVCPGSTTVMNLTGLLPNTTSTIFYSINGVAQTPVANVISNGTGNASFTTTALTVANNGQVLKITGVTTTSYSPNCNQAFSLDVILAVNSTPTFTTCPTTVNLNTSAGTCTAAGTYSVATSGVPASTYTYTFTGATTGTGNSTGSGATFNQGTTHVKVTATNTCGSVDCTFDVIVTDNIAPVISGCPSDITVYTGAGVSACDQVASWIEPTASDNCTASGSLVWTKSHSPGNIFSVGTTTVTYTVKDANNIAASCSFKVTVVDNTKPTFTPPAATTIYTDASCNASRLPAITGNVTVKSDNCTPVSSLVVGFTDAPNVAGACPGSYSFTRTWTVSDLSGNSVSDTQVITVSDNIKPTLTVPPAKAIYCTDSSLPANTGQATATDNCLGTVTVTYTDVTAAGTCGGNSTVTRTWKATDCSGNSTTANQLITITDNQAPVVTITNFTVATPDLIPLPYSTLAAFLADGGTASDNCSAPVDILLWSEVANGLDNKPGYCPTSITRTYRFTDQCGNNVDKAQTITIQNDGGCSKCTSGTTFEWVDMLGNPTGSMVFAALQREGKCCNATGSDECISFNVRIDPSAVGVEILIDGATPSSQDWRIDCNPINMSDGLVCMPGGDFHLFTFCKPGSNKNTYTFRSIPGIVTSEGISTRVECSGQITTTGIVSGATWNSISPGAPGQYNSYLSSTTVPNPIFTAAPGAPSVIKYEVCGNIGTTICNALGRDCAEVTINVKQKIALSLNVNPTLTCVNNPLVLVADINPSSNYTYEWHTGQDAISPTVLSTSKTLTLSPPVALGWYSLKVTDVDASGYACSTDTFNFQVQADLTGPSVLVPPSGDLTVNCNNPNANALIQSWLASATSTDDAGNPLTVSNNYTGISMVCGTVLPVIFSATDNCGNNNTATANIRVTDNVAPTWLSAAGTLNRTVECSDAAALLAAQALAPVAVDACDLTLTLAKTSGSFVAGSCPLAGTFTNTWTATDDCGNVSAIFTQVITITDTQGPVWMTPAGNLDRTVSCSDAAGLAAAKALAPVATDLCDGSPGLTKTSGAFVSSGCGGAGTYTNTWIAKDACNNTSAVYTQVITISPATLPTMTAPSGIAIACGTLPASSTLPFTNGETGSCFISGTSNPSTFSAMPGTCGGTVTETWTATDACGRALTPVTRTITISPATLPTMTAPAALTIACGASLPASSTIAFTNGGSGGCLITGISNTSTFSPMPSGACGGTVTETWTATDACGRALTPVTRTITISPATLPTMTAPADITVACGALPTPSTLPYSNGETGGCLISGTSNMSTLSAQSPAGACGGIIIETWTATDACGRALAPVTRTITVSPAALPTMTALANTTLACGAALPAATRRPYTNGGASGCVMSGNSNFSTFSAMPPDACGGTVTETWTATDACGRALTPVSRTITISPATLPTMTAPALITIACGDPLPDPSTLTYSNSKTGGCLITGQSNPSTFSAMPGACGGTVTETWTATDNCGRALAPVTRRITVSPAPLPTMTALADITVDCGALPAPSTIPYTNGAAGGCLISGTSNLSTLSAQSPAGACGGTIIETWRATDACGRALTPVTRTITVNPAPLPTMTPPADITVNCTAIPAPSTRTFTNGLAVPCKISGTSNLSTLSANPGACGGTMTETWTATDACGRALAPITRTITVNPAALPTMTAPSAITIACGDPLPDPSTLTYTNSGAGGCVITGQSNPSTFSAMPGACGGTVTETWTATDECGRTLVPKTRIITISPAPLPTMTAPADITVDCGTLPAPSTIPYTNGAAGGCLISGTSNLSTLSAQSPAGACGGIIIETWRATDACGRALAPVTRTITVNPAPLPTMTAPADITVACTAIPAPSTRTFTNGLAVPCKISGTSNLSTLSANPGPCGGTMTETWTATDACGRDLAPVTRTITISPAVLPTMTAPAAITIACGDPLPDPSTLTYTNSGAGGCLMSGTSNPSTFSAMPGSCGGTVTETWTATDECGRALAAKTRIITISPAPLPTMTAPADITVDCGALPAPSTIPYTNGAAGGCLISGTSNMSTFSAQSPAGACGGTIIETWKATDACGRVLTPVTRTITVNPAPLPTMTAPADITISCGTAPVPSTIAFTNGLAAPCKISGTSNPSTFSAPPSTCSGTMTETWTATDACGRALAPITRTIHIVDNTAPVMNTQAQNGSSDCVSVDPNTDAGYVAWLSNHGGATASDVCDNNLDWTDNSGTQNWVMDLINHTKKITITFTVTDDCGNSTATAPKTYTLYDNLPPVITFCPTDVAEEIAPDGCSKTNVNIGVPIYNDLCSTPSITYTLSGATIVNNGTGLIPSSQVFNLGKTTVTYKVTDDTGLSVTCSFEVWIKRLDIPMGVITCPVDPAPVAAQSGSCTASVTLNAPTVVDPCPTAGYTIVNSFNNTNNASGNYPVGTTTVLWTITDNSNNINTSCSQTVVVNDTQVPTIICQNNVEETISADNCSKTGVNITPPVVTDNCPNPLLTWTLTGVTSGNGTGPIPASQVFNVGKTRVHYTVSDTGGLADTCSFQVWIKHLDIPQAKIDCPASPAPVDAEPNKCTAFVTVNTPTIIDPCPTAGYTIVNSFNNTNNASGNYPVGTTTVVWTITDNSANTNTSCSQTVVVKDTQLPVISACPVARTIVDCTTSAITGPALSTILAASSYAEFSDATNKGVATDQCGIVTVNYIDVISGTCPITITRKWTVLDGAGNRTTCDQIITIVDNEAPTVSCPTAGFITPSDFDLSYGTYSIPAFAYSDNCTPVSSMDISWTLSGATSGSGTGLIPTPYQFNTGVTTVSYVFKDLCGNSTPCQFTVTALSPPDITCLSAPKTYNTDSGTCIHRLPTDINNPGAPTNNKTETLTWIWTILNPDGTTGATGTSTGVTAPLIDPYDFQLGTSTINWRVENASGHADCSHQVIVEDKQPPVFTAVPVEFCVDPLSAAYYTGDADNLAYSVNYPVADYHLFSASPDLDINLSTYLDNCCLITDDYTLRWTIDFQGNNPAEPSVSGIGQPSSYGTDIKLWGDGLTFQNRIHTISYWITDCHGNESAPNTVNITIKPRPNLIKTTITNP